MSKWAKGFVAATEGQSLSDNPYYLFSPSWSQWNRGWMDGNRFRMETAEFFNR